MINEVRDLLIAEQRARSTLHAAVIKMMADDEAEIARLRLALTHAVKECSRCAAIGNARALCGVETVDLG